MHADAAAEMPVVLRLLGGSVEVESAARGRRTIPADELFLGPLESSVEHDEIAIGAFFPALPAGAGVAFEEIARRHGDYALCGVAALVALDGDRDTVRGRLPLRERRPDRRRPVRRCAEPSAGATWPSSSSTPPTTSTPPPTTAPSWCGS